MTVATPNVFRFADFEVREQELRATRAAQPLSIEPKAFRVLLYLLHHAGHLVPKEVLFHAVWGDTAVTDNSLTRAIALLRRVLDDDPHQPHFIETVATAGYRFICPVEVEDESSGASTTLVTGTSDEGAGHGRPASNQVPASRREKRRRWAITAGSAMLLALLAGAAWYLGRPLPPLRVTSYLQLTSDGRLKTIEGTDGNNIYLNLWGPPSHGTVPLTGGGVREFPIDLPTAKDSPGQHPILLDVSPDGSELLVGSDYSDTRAGSRLWVVSTPGSAARHLASDCTNAAWSPDGRTIVYSNGRGDIYTVPSEGGEARLLLASSVQNGNVGAVYGFAWSPDGNRIRFVGNDRYWEVSTAGTNAHEILPHWHAADPKYLMWSGHWTPDGDFFLFAATSSVFTQDLSSRSQIWALDERHPWLRRPNREPVQLTTGATYWGGMQDASRASEGNFALSKDGSRIYSTGSTLRGELLIHNSNSKQLQPYLGGISAESVDFTRDGKYMVYVTYPDGVMWRANRDGSGLMQLNTRPLYPINPRWSPDGTQISFFTLSPSSHTAMYTIPIEGGTPKHLVPGDGSDQGDPNWSPDGKRVVFSQGFEKIRILEIATGRITDLPPSPKPAFSPRWSPDGRYILALPRPDDLALFDLLANRWSILRLERGQFFCNWPTWSHDGRFIYFLSIDRGDFKTDKPGVYRIPVTGGEPEKVVDLKGFTSTGYNGHWFGLDPDDNPILLRYAGMREIFALTLERK